MAYVNIVLSDRGWILERLAREIATRLPYVNYSTAIDPAADIQYYMTYSTWQKRVSPVEVGFFAHLEVDEGAKKKFFSVAREIDHCICMSNIYQNILQDHGIREVTTIPPGVDFEDLKPIVKIGVVGRTYHTGRKGETLVRQVMDIPNIEWHFTGEGWPGPARHIPDGKMSDFYNSMDYILVPALYEGGPMCVIEALACGCEVIAPPIGWVSDFPHIEYRTGDAEDLRRVLTGIVQQKSSLRNSVLGQTWDAWAEAHNRLFSELAKQHNLSPLQGKQTKGAAIGRVALVMHGDEGKSLGGPSVRVPKTAEELRYLGYEAQVLNFPDHAIKDVDVIHAFNVWSPISGQVLARYAASNRKPFVLSSIFLDLSEREFWHDQILGVFSSEEDPEKIDAELLRVRVQFELDRDRGLYMLEGMPGHHQRVREMVDIADHVILLSEKEKEKLNAIGATPKTSTIVHNPVDVTKFSSADPELFSKTYGLKDYILCVARLEPRKNQLLMLHALRGLDIPIVLIGHSTNQQYHRFLERYQTENVHFIGRLDPNDPLLQSAIAGARVFVLPSWCEGAPLAALEAAATGANMVLSDRSSEIEYFGDFARYCDPGNLRALRETILDAYNNPFDAEQKNALKQHVLENFSWKRYATKTGEVYEKACQSHSERPTAAATISSISSSAVPTGKRRRIVLDITTSCYHKGRWTGISRSEMSLAQALISDQSVEERFIAWNHEARRFVEIPSLVVHEDYLQAYFELTKSKEALPLSINAGDPIIVCGSAWMQNSIYADVLVELSNTFDASLIFIVCDIIPTKFPFWFDEKYTPVFERNISLLLRRADQIFGISQNTVQDIEEFAFTKQIPIVKPKVYYLGEELSGVQPDEMESVNPDVSKLFKGKRFVLNVGAIHSRKNHRLLYDIWVSLFEKYGTRCPHLVIVGGVAWNGHDVARAFREDRRLQGIVHIVENINDATLNWLYEHCLFTVYPSLYEGWGLPVAESLAHGKICVASNSSSIPEISETAIDLLDPLDFKAWYSRIDMYLTSHAVRARREEEVSASYKARGWNEAVSELLSDINSFPSRLEDRVFYTPGSKLRLVGTEAALFKAGGWHMTEKWGIWASEQVSHLRLHLSKPTEQNLIFTVKVRSLIQEGNTSYCDVKVNDYNVGRITFTNCAAISISFALPKEAVSAKSTLDIQFISSCLTSPRTNSPKSVDSRFLGVGIEEICICPSEDFYLTQKSTLPSVTPSRFCRVNETIWLPDFSDLPLLFGSNVVSDPAWGVRASSGPLQLILNIHEMLEIDLTLVLRFRACATPTSPFKALVTDSFARIVGRVEAYDDSIHLVRLPIPASMRANSTPLILSFGSEEQRSPSDLNIGHLQDRFGLGLFEITIESDEITPSRSIIIDRDVSITFEELVLLGQNENNLKYLDSTTWHKQEEHGIWSFGELGRLTLCLPEVPVDGVILELFGTSLISSDDGNEITVHINDVEHFTSVREHGLGGCIEVEISPDELTADGTGSSLIDVEIHSKSVTSPFLLHGSPDDRLLGFHLSGFRVRDATDLSFDLDSNSIIYLNGSMSDKVSSGLSSLKFSNWHDQEEFGIWSNGSNAKLLFELAHLPSKAFGLEVIGFPFIPLEEENEIQININGEPVAIEILQDSELYKIRMKINPGLITVRRHHRSILEVELHTKYSDRPSLRSVSTDNRHLGFFLRGFSFEL